MSRTLLRRSVCRTPLGRSVSRTPLRRSVCRTPLGRSVSRTPLRHSVCRIPLGRSIVYDFAEALCVWDPTEELFI